MRNRAPLISAFLRILVTAHFFKGRECWKAFLSERKCWKAFLSERKCWKAFLSERIPKTPLFVMRSIWHRCCIVLLAHPPYQRIFANFSDRALFKRAQVLEGVFKRAQVLEGVFIAFHRILSYFNAFQRILSHFNVFYRIST